uniref:Putative lipoprotein releasing system, transmembrane protein, LolC/E family n=1 Tax=uncultured Aquificaceae bacterium TaxID=374108 RepID=A0A146JCH7_9AQUI|nr:putative lipoprotein releasing system, transmembrane protein, LolC/E family [uncultured Aquificaceae bacterium]
MKIPLYLKISLRYLLSIKSNLLSFMTVISVVGITLGVAALIVTLSVMSGFMFGLKSKLLETAPHIMILKAEDKFYINEDIVNTLKRFPEVVDYEPFVYTQGILSKDSQVLPVYVRGIDPEKDLKFMNIKDKLILGEYNPSENCVVLRKDLAVMLSATRSDQLN